MMCILWHTVQNTLEAVQKQVIKEQVQYWSVHKKITAVLQTNTVAAPSLRYRKAVQQIQQLLLEDLVRKITESMNYEHLVQKVISAGSWKVIDSEYITSERKYVSKILKRELTQL